MKSKRTLSVLLVLSILVLSSCQSIGMLDVAGEINSDFQPYLEPSEYCNCDNPLIIEKANEIREEVIAQSMEKDLTEEELNRRIAVRSFYFVRDEIPFSSVFEFEEASETLEKEYGNCFTKSNLFASLCRANGIPARFHLIEISGKAVSDVMPKMGGLYQSENAELRHSVAEIYVGERWIRADCTRDRYLSPERSYEWDGRKDTPENPFKTKEIGTFANIDPKKVKAIKSKDDKIWKAAGNILLVYIDDLRFERSGKRAFNKEELAEIGEETLQYSKLQMRHKGNLSSVLLYFRILNGLGRMKIDLLEKTPQRVVFTTPNPLSDNSYLIYAKCLEGGARSIDPGINYEVRKNGEQFEICMTSDSEGSILAYLDILHCILKLVVNMIYTLWTR